MNGVHDMGGMHGFGAVRPETDEPMFHAGWERRALGVTLAMGGTGQWNIDMSRSAREQLPPAVYLSSSYYRIWILGLERLLLQRGLVTADELVTGRTSVAAQRLARVLRPEQIDGVLRRGSPTVRESPAPARFAPGDRVRARNQHPGGHTRLPRYVRGHVGTVVHLHGCHVFADRHAVPRGNGSFDESPEWLYTVAFDASELWGADAEPGTTVSVDAWEPYLEPAAA